MSDVDEAIKQITDAVTLLKETNFEVVGHFGCATVEGARTSWWSIRSGEPSTKLLAIPDYRVAQVLSVLGSEVRLAILRYLKDGPRAASEIVAGVGLNTTGQAYHHLRDLERAGYVEQRAGGRYHVVMNGYRVYLSALNLATDLGAEQTDEAQNTGED
jgi:DNA-binding transcriptional ArsR family regulator